MGRAPARPSLSGIRLKKNPAMPHDRGSGGRRSCEREGFLVSEPLGDMTADPATCGNFSGTCKEMPVPWVPDYF